jgi:hypothetical protein
MIIGSPCGQFTAAAKARAIEVVYKTIIYDASYKNKGY